MSVNFVPNLQMMACVQTAIPILNISEMQDLIDSYSLGFKLSQNMEVCTMIEKTAVEKILSLGLATSLQMMVKNCVMNMFSQIIECKNTYSLVLTGCSNHVNKNFKFFWKHDGTVDQMMTVKALIENKDLNVKERFVLASRFCLADDALCLWKNMIETQKFFTPLELECQPLVKLWIEMYEEGSVCMKITPKILGSSILQSNICMLRHVTKMLPYERQRPYLLSIALKGEISIDVMAFCLSQLDKSDQEIVFKNSTIKVLQCALTWPYQSMFKNVADYLWTNLSKEGFCDILWLILLKIMHQEWSDFRLIEILKEFWFESPAHFKEHAKQQSIYEPLKIVLNCGMEYFPIYALSEACIQSMEKFLPKNLSRIILGCLYLI
ncbi:unnamed protein product [Larinioides sclopetarius]|uniref:Uncharacterized protein n=1 Tax=Larinioides sclopetarius TaxID=280406 RepID=A0AAV2BS81_9ARAC